MLQPPTSTGAAFLSCGRQAALYLAARRCLLLAAAALMLSGVGCTTYSNRLTHTRRELAQGKIAAAIASVDDNIAKTPGDANVLKLDRAILELADGRPRDAEQTLRQVRNEFDHLEQGSLVEDGYSLFSDDTRRAYAGENYETVLIRALLAISNLMHDGGDAEAYALQISARQREIHRNLQEQNKDFDPASHRQVALGPYVQAAIREESPTRNEEVTRARAQVVSWMPEFSPGKEDLHRASFASHSSRGNGVLYVFAMVGHGPQKVEAVEPVSSVSLLLADRILSAMGDQELPPTIAPVKIPRVVAGESVVQNIGVSVDGEHRARTETLVDVNAFALEQYEAALPGIVARTVVRRIVKKGAVYSAKTAVGAEENVLADVALTLAGIAWEASESADTRCWGLLPGRIQVLRLELPAGKHTIELEPRAAGGACAQPATVAVNIENGRNTFLLGHFPEKSLAGKLLVR